MTKTADTDEFHDEMDTNPLGDLVESKAIGRFLIELYEKPIGHHKRRREGKEPRGVVTVWETAGEDHHRGYRNLGSTWFSEERARAEYAGLRSVEGVEAFLAENEE